MTVPRNENTFPRTLLIGGAGFLGSHLCERLLSAGHEVICLDSLLTGRFENIQHLLGNPRFVFVRHDVTQRVDLPCLVRSQAVRPEIREGGASKIDYVLHLASPASPKAYGRYPIHTLKTGALGTLHALGLAKTHKSVFLLASTSEIYGDAEVNPQPETYWGHVNPLGTRSVYDEAKRYAESMTMAYHRQHGVQVRIARIFNTYGKRMRVDDGRAIPNFMTQALQGKPLTIYGDGSQTRSFCYVSDLIEGIYQLLLSQETGPVNLGNPEEITLLKLAETIIKMTESQSRTAFEPLPLDDPVRRRPDISKARTVLKWQPKIGLREGIKRVIPYFRAQLTNRWLHQSEPAWKPEFPSVDKCVA